MLTEIINEMNVTKTLASVAIMGSLITYGIVQIISGFFGDKYKSEKIIFIGLFGSAFINLVVCLFPNIYVMNVVWCLNGAFQSLIWPSLVRMIVDNLSDEYSNTVVRVSQSSYVATVLIYLLAPVIISAFHWRAVFAFTGVLSMGFSFFWLKKTKKLQSVSVREDKKEEKIPLKINKKEWTKFLISIGFIPMLISTIAAGFLRDGISVWMPTYISDVYSKSSFFSILTGAVIPIFCALFLDVFKKAGEKIGNELKAASIFYGIAFFACTVLLVFFSTFPALDIVLMSIITVCIHGVNLMIVCTVPKRFSKYGKSSTMSGIFNSAVYAGSAASAFGTAVMASNLGWKTVCFFWGALIFFALILCAAWKKKYEKIIDSE